MSLKPANTANQLFLITTFQNAQNAQATTHSLFNSFSQHHSLSPLKHP